MSAGTRIGLCTVSGSLLSPEMVSNLDVVVVPVTVTVGGVDYLDGVDLGADAFYEMLSAVGQSEAGLDEVVTSPPSPGQFAAAFDELIDRGCGSILSIHASSTVSAAISAARLAAKTVPVPVRVLDTGTASFGVSCCLHAAAKAIADGATLDEAAGAALEMAGQLENVVVLGQQAMLASGSGPIDMPAGATASADAETAHGLPVLSFSDGQLRLLGRALSVEAAVEMMAAKLTTQRRAVDAAIGTSDRRAETFGALLRQRLRDHPLVSNIIDYRIGPAIGVYVGSGALGCFSFPVGLISG